MNTYQALADYNADTLAARNAYRADTAVNDGYCGHCLRRKRDQGRRICRTCRQMRRRSL